MASEIGLSFEGGIGFQQAELGLGLGMRCGGRRGPASLFPSVSLPESSASFCVAWCADRSAAHYALEGLCGAGRGEAYETEAIIVLENGSIKGAAASAVFTQVKRQDPSSIWQSIVELGLGKGPLLLW